MGEPIRVLHILQRMEAGGTQALLMNIYRKIDRTKVQFDFLVVYKEKQFYDDEIEKILEETEEAKCNVAQGYNVFKKLKELRLERKAKMEELKCLYVLTDYIDCEALADTCEDNLDEIEEILDVPNLKNVVIEVEKNDISEQSKDVVSQVMAGRSDEKQMENVEGMVS
mgnify:CR=1 FL=1